MLKKFFVPALLVLYAVLFPAYSSDRSCIFAAPMAIPIFINEIHYDNTGTDTGEAIEIAGPAGTNFSGWNLVLYNGANGQVYDTDPVAGTIPDQCSGYGTITLSYPTDGLQNGAPDGIALVDNTNTVIQFLSYEGTFTATNGPANGLTSTDIGVSETATTPVGYSLQLAGTGVNYEDFHWTGASANTFGACNTGQVFFKGPKVLATTPVDGETVVATNTQISITFSEDVTVTPPWYTFTCTVSGNHTATESGGPQIFMLDPDTDLSANETCTVTIIKDQVVDQDDTPDPMQADYTFTFSTGRWVINEIHADPDAIQGDANGDGIVNVIEDEFIEIVNTTGAPVSIAGWTLSDFVGVKHTFPAGTTIPDN